ncbi:transmembrane channel-like protein [Anopheles cruzii]|uniref:transmembrane channel-like protein n=1 Tax=Anopheles cruzii TaxID=68878 RepID=UPI0022EC94BE|nr:transmembrane channel-like protein [Anopheles cruzii]
MSGHEPAGPRRARKKPSGILKLDSGARRRESSGSSLLQLGGGGDELSPPSSSVSPQLSVTWAFPPIRAPPGDGQPQCSAADSDLSTEHQHPVPVEIPRETISAADGGDGRQTTAATTPAAAATASKQPRGPAKERTKVHSVSTGSAVMKAPDTPLYIGAEIFPGGHDGPVDTDFNLADGDHDDDDEDYSASINAIIQRKASVKKRRGYKGHRRASSPLSQMMGLPGGTESAAGTDRRPGGDRRRSSVYTTSSGETGVTLPEDSIGGGGGVRSEESAGGRQDKLFDTIRLHKEVLQTVKLQPISMKRKLRLVQQAKSYITRHEGALQEHFTSRTARSLLAQFSIFLTTKWQQLLRELANLATYLIPWESRIKEIESHFGSVVASYFTFLRWLFSVNIVISVLLVVFIMVPEEIYVDADKAKCDIRKTMSRQERALTRNFSTIWEFEGPLKYSILFYGYYSTFSGAIAWGYNLPLAYFFTGLVVYIYSFVATLKKMAENSRMSKLSSKDDEYVFSWKLFTGWDYMIGHMETSQNRMASIILGFKEALLEEAEKKKDTQNWKIILLRILVNFLILGLLVISAYEVIQVVKRSMDLTDTDSWWRRNEITVVMSLISFFFPMIFEALGMMEYYHPRKQLRIQLARIMVLNMLNLYSLIFALFDKIAHMTGELRRIKPTNFTTSAELCFVPDTSERWGGMMLPPDKDSKYRDADIRSLCWETMFGQELAKLTVMDLLVTIVSTLIMDVIRALFVRYMNNCWCWDLEKKFPMYGDFKIAENILHLVNNQGMVWMGMFFSPGLAVLNIAKLVVILYLRSWTVLTCNVPHEVVFRASRSNNFYFALLLTMLFLCVLPVSYAIVFLEPSWHCGPFSNSNRIYHLLTNATERIVPEMITKYIVSPAAIIPLLVLLILIIYYLISLTGSLREANQDLKLQLRKERTEERRKMFKIASSTQQHQQQQQQSGSGAIGPGMNGLSSSWHKVLDSTQLRLQSTTDNATTDSENSATKHKELLQRMMKRALQKEQSVEAVDDPQGGPPLPVVGTENEKQQRTHRKPEPEAEVFRFDARTVEQIHRADRRVATAATDEDRTVELAAGTGGAGSKSKFDRTRPSTAERFRMAARAERQRMQNQTADWIEQIPVITISKTSSDECIIDSDPDRGDERNEPPQPPPPPPPAPPKKKKDAKARVSSG